jgi:hypothetical protein
MGIDGEFIVNRATRVLAFLILAQAAMVCSTFNEWSTLGVLTAALVGIVLWNQRRQLEKIRMNQERGKQALATTKAVNPLVIMLGMFVISLLSIIWRLPESLGDKVNFVAVAVDIMAHVSLLSSIMLWSLRPARGHLMMPFLGLALILLCVASGGVSRSLQAQTTVGVLACLGFVAATKIVFASHRYSSDWDAHQWEEANRLNSRPDLSFNRALRQRKVALIATATMLVMVTGAVASVTEDFLPVVQNDLQQRLQSTFDAVQSNRFVGGMRYVRGSSLGSVGRHLMTDPNAVVLNVYADQRPGYLRGNVFDLYRDSRWYSIAEQYAVDLPIGAAMIDRMIQPSGRGTVDVQSSPSVRLNRFQLSPVESGRQAQMEIVGDPMRGNNAFLPLGVRWIEAVGYSLTLTGHHTIRVGIDNSKPYIVGAESVPTQSKLTPTERMYLTEIAPKQKEKLILIADRIFREADSTTEKAAAVRSFFQSEFEYGLQPIKRPPGADPILYFLKTRHPAHCEYFATATVLLLRAAGVPTRYVVGYVADEESDDRDRWVARNRDAHAWVEAYDDQTERWFPVEATPGRQYQSVLLSKVVASQSLAGQSGKQNSSSSVGGFLSSIWGYLFSLRATDTFFAVFRYFQIAILVGLVGWLIRRLRRANETQREAAERACRKMLVRVDRMLGRKGYIRGRSESLYQFASRVENGLSMANSDRYPQVKRQQMQRAASWLRSFADARYQGKMPPDWAG